MSVYDFFSERLRELKQNGNLRDLPAGTPSGTCDLSSNDYLGIAEDRNFADKFLGTADLNASLFTSSASRLLGPRQNEYMALEQSLHDLYKRPALLFNSGYHANIGVVQTLADRNTLVLADKLIHASVIDGLRLAGASFERFRHNDVKHLQHLLEKRHSGFDRILVIVESVYSMDGDSAPLGEIAELKKYYSNMLLYVDEAHAIGVCGPSGLGCVADLPMAEDVDIIVGTLGKALASSGAFVICNGILRHYLINHARSLIFSTALPPLQACWSRYVVEHMVDMDDRRLKLKQLGTVLQKFTNCKHSGHIQPLLCGSAEAALSMSGHLLDEGYKVLPIRTPTVPPGTERLRFSLSAAIDSAVLEQLMSIKNKIPTAVDEI